MKNTKLTITNLKHIKRLEFEIPKPGAYLLSGGNGSGKTSLLTCLSRMRNSAAFQHGFRSSSHKSLDSHRGASVQYDIAGDCVTYTYVEERWAPLPRKNSGLLGKCGYPEVKYVAADGERVEPKKEEFTPRRVKPADSNLVKNLNTIFGTSRFDNLCYINLNRGGKSKAFLIKDATSNGKSSTYFSEKNFSLGELCVLRLLQSLEDISNNSLLLIDELELAIHPRVQAKLFHHLDSFSKQKNLTIIFSTHSVSLIKQVDRRKLLFLSNNNGEVQCLQGCYPTYALGQITAGEEIAPDCVIYVEDDSAKKCVESMIDLYFRSVGAEISKPSTLVIPLGGFTQILEFLDKAPQLLPDTTKITTLLDKDVETESIQNYKNFEDHYMLDLFAKLEGQVNYLPWTPEIGIVEMLSEETIHENGLKRYFSENRIHFPRQWKSAPPEPVTGKKSRDAAKKSLHNLCSHLENVLGKSRDRIREDLFDYFIINSHNPAGLDLVSKIGKIIHR
jgi:energy-coupling factor transporter ATP-binding protein EcfA2